MKKTRVLSLFTLTMINIAAIGSVKNWPLTAEYGLSSISYLILAALIFLLPLALVTAELATTWPQNGGIFIWVKHAFGHRIGFLVIWLFWMLNVIWYPTLLSFIAVTFVYIFNPALVSSNTFLFHFILITFWVATLLNLMGMKVSGWISTLGAICGTFIPGLLIISLGLIWWLTGRPSQISFHAHNLIPNLSSINQLVFFMGILLSLSGIEMSAIHAKDVQNPKKDYPRSILIAGFIIIGFSILGVLSIASVIPQSQINLVAGSMQAFSFFFDTYHLSWLIPFVSLMMVWGAFGSLSSWIAGTSRGLLAAATDGDLPPYFRAVNKKGMPARLLIIQAVLVSILSLFFIYMPSLNRAFWYLSALLTQLYLIVYLILFAAALKLRYTMPHVPRPYRIPGGKLGMGLCWFVGTCSCLFAIFVGFFPPSQFSEADSWVYALSLLGGAVLCCVTPSIILLFQKPHWKTPLHLPEKD